MIILLPYFLWMTAIAYSVEWKERKGLPAWARDFSVFADEHFTLVYCGPLVVCLSLLVIAIALRVARK